jgi:hypothetical protein
VSAPALCDECGAPRASGGGRCARCGAAFTDAVKAHRSTEDTARAARAWRLATWATLVFVAAGQVTQWLTIAHDGLTAWRLSRALGLLALGLLVAWQLGRRSELALVLWGWVMNASVVVMALTFAATARWAPLRGFDLWLTVWAWATVAAYAAVLWRLRRVVLSGSVG